MWENKFGSLFDGFTLGAAEEKQEKTEENKKKQIVSLTDMFRKRI